MEKTSHMELFEALAGRTSIRRFKERAIPDADIWKILDAGRLAPSANNSQPWSFLVIRNRAVLGKMGDAVRRQVDRMIPHAENEKQTQRLTAYKTTFYTFFENAPAVIAVFMEAYDASVDRLLARMGSAPGEVTRLRPNPGLQSVAAAVQNMLLAAYALGYGSCWMTGPLVAQEEFENLLGYGKEKSMVAILPIGVPGEEPAARPRKPLKDLVKFLD
jgi:nitroreductase